MPSTYLRLLYGADYEQNLGSGCINFAKEAADKNWRLSLRALAFSLVVFNYITAFYHFPIIGMLTFFTNWCMHFTTVSILLITWFGSKADIHLHKGRLATLHILYELSVLSNAVTVIIYWGMIHNEVIDRF